MANFIFHGFTLRTAQCSELYYRIAEAWIKADPDHCETTSAGFWFEQAENHYSYILEDKFGVVFFFKMVWHGPAEVELHMQFPPTQANPAVNVDQRVRVMRGITEGFQWIERVLAIRNVSTLFFVSKSPSLIRFCQKRLGFSRRICASANGERLEKAIGEMKAMAASATV